MTSGLRLRPNKSPRSATAASTATPHRNDPRNDRQIQSPRSNPLEVEQERRPLVGGIAILDRVWTTEKSPPSPFLSAADCAAREHPALPRHYCDVAMSSSNSGSNSPNKNDSSPVLPLPALAFQEIVLGDVVGRGGFSFVHEIKYVKLQEIYDTGDEEAESRARFAAIFDAAHSSPPPSSGGNIHNSDNNIIGMAGGGAGHRPPSQRYVLKTLRPDLPEDEHNKGIIDLAVESQFLCSLSHPRILSIRGHANSDPLESRYFVILDRLVSTLDHRLKLWRRDVGTNMGFWFGPCLGYCCSRSHVLRRIWTERFEVARDIASALDYLHGQDIVYRDLKPDNVGFNSEGELKMFDFGLAKRVTSADRSAEDRELYNLTGNTGSLRYMAPEVALNRPYSLSVDAYSFGVLLWQLCSLSVPYSGFSCKMHSDMVVGKGYRPTPDQTWPESWGALMGQCWSVDHRVRPTFDRILVAMNAELEEWAASAEGFGDFMANESGTRGVESIKAKRGKSVFKIRARKDGHRLDADTRLAKPEGATERMHDANIV
jgi:serine/threonine protein kinase